MEESEICADCNGSGEGKYEGSSCAECGGGGSNSCETCDYCGGFVNKKYKNIYVHKDCYSAGRAEAMGEI